MCKFVIDKREKGLEKCVWVCDGRRKRLIEGYQKDRRIEKPRDATRTLSLSFSIKTHPSHILCMQKSDTENRNSLAEDSELCIFMAWNNFNGDPPWVDIEKLPVIIPR